MGHVLSQALTDSSLHPELCPVGNESWCRYQIAKAREKILFRHSPHILYWRFLS